MRTIAAAIVLVGASPAFADTLAPTSVSAVQLQAGHDYALEADGPDGAAVDLVQPDGHVAVHLPAQDSPDVGAEFRATIGGTWHVRVFDASNRTDTRLEADCPGGVRTRCVLTPKNGGPRSFAWSSDSDWNRVSLRAGFGYSFVYHGDQVDGLLILHDAQGRELARSGDSPDETLAFRAPRTGTYLLEVHNTDLDFPGKYTITMR
jgi:hypothetical protein